MTRLDQTRQDVTRQDKTRPDETRFFYLKTTTNEKSKMLP